VGSLDGDAPRRVTESQTQAEFSQGHLLTVQDDALLATPLDPGTLETKVGTVPVVEDVMIVSEGAVLAAYSTSSTGTLVFQRGTNQQDRKLEWIDLESGQRTDLGTRGQLFFPMISPDGSTAVEAFLRVTDVVSDESHLLVAREDEAGTVTDVVVLPLDGSGEPAVSAPGAMVTEDRRVWNVGSIVAEPEPEPGEEGQSR
jgi:hypothetical protein